MEMAGERFLVPVNIDNCLVCNDGYFGGQINGKMVWFL